MYPNLFENEFTEPFWGIKTFPIIPNKVLFPVPFAPRIKL